MRPLLLLLLGCDKVPIHNVNAEFLLADVSWFAEEETLFAFYDVSAEQGLSDNSVLEITYTTDAARVDWTPLENLPPVHTHEAVDCGTNRLCGSVSVRVADVPRDVRLRMRYHRDGALALYADTVYNVVGPGEAATHRSFVVYGVMDEANQQVQWRGRHQFPTLRNEQAQKLGLRRWFQVTDAVYGTATLSSTDNPYGYGVVCPPTFEDAGLGAVETEERAVWAAEALPLEASDHAVVCGQSTVRDATGTYTTGATARKNPEVRAAFPVLRSPIRDATVLPFFLMPCDRTISEEHEAMQRQRLLVGDLAPTCIDDWATSNFDDTLTELFTDAIEAERAEGKDMVLVIGLHQDASGVSETLERALAAIVPEERERSSPHLAGAFVFDSEGYTITAEGLGRSTLWCPASIAGYDTGEIPDASLQGCPILPDDLLIDLGPFTFGTLPILPPRDQYLEFIESFSPNQAGEVQEISFRTPEFATTSEHAEIGDYGVVTFLNDEQISVGDDDAFSYCVTDDAWIVVFRSDLLQSPLIQEGIAAQCESGELSEELCSVVTQGLLPISYLPDWHLQFPEDTYKLGLFWDFPFLLHMEYEAVAAGSVTAFGFSVPFGLGQDGESYLGSNLWTTEEFPLDDQLTQCTRFCDQPTFDAAGVYHVTDPFRSTYPDACYQPLYPTTSDDGFPLDP